MRWEWQEILVRSTKTSSFWADDDLLAAASIAGSCGKFSVGEKRDGICDSFVLLIFMSMPFNSTGFWMISMMSICRERETEGKRGNH